MRFIDRTAVIKQWFIIALMAEGGGNINVCFAKSGEGFNASSARIYALLESSSTPSPLPFFSWRYMYIYIGKWDQCGGYYAKYCI